MIAFVAKMRVTIQFNLAMHPSCGKSETDGIVSRLARELADAHEWN
jgi:hypothetical protein